VRPWSGLGSRIVKAIQARQRRKQEQAQGAHGDFYRSGGNRQLHEQLPVTDTDWVWDVGGYHGESTVGMLARYGCHRDVFEPVPAFVETCQQLFAHNRRVRLHAVRLGEKGRTTRFSLLETGTSEFSSSDDMNNLNEHTRQVVTNLLLIPKNTLHYHLLKRACHVSKHQ